MNIITANSYAKINLTLDILRKLDGYHEINSIMQAISLCDVLTFEENDDVTVQCKNIPQEHNLAYKAAILLKQSFSVDHGIKIKIRKNIPIGAGLGGGSSNAATTLLTLNKLWDLNLNQNQLEKLAVQIGMDVAFFLYSGTCFVSGKGEIVRKIKQVPYLDLLLVYTNINISTKQAYASLDYNVIGKKQSSARLLNALEKNAFDAAYLHNDFEYSIFKQYSLLADIKNKIIANGAVNALLSGSGSTVYGVFDDVEKLDKTMGLFKGYSVIRTKTARL